MFAVRDPYHLRIAAGAIRLLLVAIAYAGLAPLNPAVHALRWLFLGYFAAASVFLVLIALRIGDRPRAIAGAVIDLSTITVMVHALGSTTSVLPTVYVFAAVLNTMTVGPRVGMIVSMLACAAYGALLGAEHLGILALTPGVEQASGLEATVSFVLTSFMLLATTTIVASLLRTNIVRQRELEAANAKLLAITNRDPLTDLWNRRYLFEQLGAHQKRGGSGYAVAVFDLDGFKAVNDRRGHLEGDDLLRRIAEALRSVARTDDVVCRFGGDEFVVLFRDTTLERAHELVEAMRAKIRLASTAFDAEGVITASVGLTQGRAEDRESTDAMKRADALAYRAKRAGKDRVVSDEGG